MESLGQCFDDGLLGVFSGGGSRCCSRLLALDCTCKTTDLVDFGLWLCDFPVWFLHCSCRTVVPNSFVTGIGFPEDSFSMDQGGKGDILGMIQVHYLL